VEGSGANFCHWLLRPANCFDALLGAVNFAQPAHSNGGPVCDSVSHFSTMELGLLGGRLAGSVAGWVGGEDDDEQRGRYFGSSKNSLISRNIGDHSLPGGRRVYEGQSERYQSKGLLGRWLAWVSFGWSRPDYSAWGMRTRVGPIVGLNPDIAFGRCRQSGPWR